jgi:hypothetical protein
MLSSNTKSCNMVSPETLESSGQLHMHAFRKAALAAASQCYVQGVSSPGHDSSFGKSLK